jgi:hypothetical protein
MTSSIHLLMFRPIALATLSHSTGRTASTNLGVLAQAADVLTLSFALDIYRLTSYESSLSYDGAQRQACSSYVTK